MRVLYISSSNHRVTTGGTVLLRSILEGVPPEKLVWVAYGVDQIKFRDWMLPYNRYIVRSLLFGRVFNKLFCIWPFSRIGIFLKYFYFHKRGLAQILRIIAREKIEGIWIHAYGPTILLASALKELTGLRIHCSIQDDVGAHLPYSEASFLRPRLGKMFEVIDSCDLTSEGMCDYYKSMGFKIPNDIYISYSGLLKTITQKIPNIRRVITSIAFAGNIWCKDEVIDLCKALEMLNKSRLAQDAIYLDIYSGALPIGLSKKLPYLRYKGQFDERVLANILLESDLLFVPMSFSPDREIASRTSFPSKIVFYCSIGIPILGYAPPYATSTCFINEHGIGYTCYAKSVSDLACLISRIELDFIGRNQCSIKMSEASAGIFGWEKQRNEYHSRIFGLDETDVK